MLIRGGIAASIEHYEDKILSPIRNASDAFRFETAVEGLNLAQCGRRIVPVPLQRLEVHLFRVGSRPRNNLERVARFIKLDAANADATEMQPDRLLAFNFEVRKR